MPKPERDILYVGCEQGHDWHSIGGCNAGCHDLCCCSVPVNTCKRCSECDYGDNEEAALIRSECVLRYGDPKERFNEEELQ